MVDLSSVMRWLGFGLAIAAACDRSEPPATTAETPPSVAAAEVAPNAKADPIPATTTATPVVTPPVVTPPVVTPPALPPPVVAAAVAPAIPGAWRVLHTAKNPIALEADVGGLVRIGGTFLEQGPLGEVREVPGLAQGWDAGPKYVPGTDLDEDEDPEMTVDYERIEGRWPDNAWHVVHLSDGRRGDQLVLRHWDGQKWRKPKIKIPGAAQSEDDDGPGPMLVAKSNTVSSYGPMMVRAWSDRGGFIIAGMDYDPFTLTPARIDAKGPIPTDAIETTEHWQLLEWTESRAGLFSYEYQDEVGYRVRRTCPGDDASCKGDTFAVPTIEEGTLVMLPAQGGMIGVQSKLAVVRFADEKFRRDMAPAGKTIVSLTADDRGGAWAVLREGTEGARSMWYLAKGGEWTEHATPESVDGKPIEPELVRMVIGPRLWMVADATLHELTPP